MAAREEVEELLQGSQRDLGSLGLGIPITFLPEVQGLHRCLDGEGSLVLVAHPGPALPWPGLLLFHPFLHELGHLSIFHLPGLQWRCQRGGTGQDTPSIPTALLARSFASPLFPHLISGTHGMHWEGP